MADWFTEAFGAVIDDIRTELIDRGWFGRNARPPDHAGSGQDHSPTMDWGDWLSGDPSPIGPNPDANNYRHPGHEPSRDPSNSEPGHDLDHGIDR
jgi:hypothetical protein